MKHLSKLLFALSVLLSLPALGQDEPVIVEAETGAVGADFNVVDEDGLQYIAINATVGGGNPSTIERTASYTVEFPAAGTYNLYARMRVGPQGFNDDSFFYSNGFGEKDPADDADWILTNNLANSGYVSTSDSPVMNTGGATSNVWKWLQLSIFDGGEAPVVFTVPEGELIQTFSIGGREDGLSFDKFAFGREGVYYFAAELDAGVAGTAPPPPPPPEPYDPPGPPMALGKDKWVGGVYSPAQAVNFTAYWNQVTPENAGKWGSVEGTRDVMNWTQLDEAYALAKDNGFPFRFHVLIWGNQQPGWIETLPVEEQRAEIEEWFAAVAARYPDIDYLEVVNEPLHDPPNQPGAGGGNYIEALGGTGETGWEWVLNAFRLAKDYFPDTALVLNEYSIVNDDNNLIPYLELIGLLQAENLIDIIGVQGHAFSTYPSRESMTENLDALAETGLPIQVTELDIDGPTDAVQLADYQRIFPTFWEHPAVMGITLWGYRPGHWRTGQGAYIAYENGAERPALQWLQAYVRNNAPLVDAGQSLMVAEDASAGDVLGTLTGSDEDAGAVLSWQITGGTGEGIFAIDAATGDVLVADAAVLDFETTTSYSLDVTVSDGYTSSDPVTIRVSVLNVNDTAPVVTPGQSFHIDGGSYYFGTLIATDADDTNAPGYSSLTNWSVTGGDGERYFALNSIHGDLKVKWAKGIDWQRDAYSLEVTVSDGENVSAVELVTIVIPDQIQMCYREHDKTVPRDKVRRYLDKGADIGACEDGAGKPWWRLW